MTQQIMRGFAGFPDGSLAITSIPDLFFTEILPHIQNLTEVKTTLHLMWIIDKMPDEVPGVSLSELRDDEILLKALSQETISGQESLQRGLELAVARGTFLQVSAQGDSREDEWFFLNDERGRRTVQELVEGEGTALLPQLKGQASRLFRRRPNLFVLYEQNIGPLTPLLADELQQAEQEYPAEWIAEAMSIAVEQNVRKWRYISAILERWQQDGRDDEAPGRGDQEDRYRYIRGKYRDYIQY